MNGNMCLSGGAEGAALQWGMTAGERGDAVVHWSFAGHRSRAPSSEIVILNEEQLALSDELLAKANLTIKRRWPIRNQFVANLLRRNFYQVMHSDSVYAVSNLDNHGQVKGGTAWATQMFIDRHNGEECPVWVYDQTSSTWNKYSGNLEGYVIVEEADVPEPRGVWTGIGSRELLDNGKQAIRRLMKWPKEAATEVEPTP